MFSMTGKAFDKNTHSMVDMGMVCSTWGRRRYLSGPDNIQSNAEKLLYGNYTTHVALLTTAQYTGGVGFDGNDVRDKVVRAQRKSKFR